MAMVDEAAENFHLLPKVTFADGTEVPYTVDVDIKMLNLESFNSDIPSDSYYQGTGNVIYHASTLWITINPKQKKDDRKCLKVLRVLKSVNQCYCSDQPD